MRATKVNIILEIVSLFIVLHLLRILAKRLLYSAFEATFFIDSMGTALAFLLFIPGVLFYAKIKNTVIPVWPEKLNLSYIVSSVVVVVFIVSTLFINKDFSTKNISLLLYSTILTPVFEELLFRGYLWERLRNIIKSENRILVLTAVLFGIWHLGYFDTLLLRMDGGNIYFTLMMKAIVGFIYGLLTGIIRKKCGNCYAPILVHAAVNVLG